MLRWLKPLVAAGWVLFLPAMCVSHVHEKRKRCGRRFALAGSGRMHTAELLLASGHSLKGDVISRGVFGIVQKKPLDI